MIFVLFTELSAFNELIDDELLFTLVSKTVALDFNELISVVFVVILLVFEVIFVSLVVFLASLLDL